MSALRVYEECLSGKWMRSRQLTEQGNRAGSGFKDWAAVEQLELEVLTGPIAAPADVAAKLSAVALSFSDGPRADGHDARALDQVIAWFEEPRRLLGARALSALPSG